MAQRRKPAPDWLDLSKYEGAAQLDARDWMLNLLVRGWLHRDGDAEFETVIRDYPVLRRHDEATRLHLRSLMSRRPPRPLQPYAMAFMSEFLTDSPVGRQGIAPLTVQDFYFFERMLPDELRCFARELDYATLVFRRNGDPSAFYGRIEDALLPGPPRLRFVRVDLGETDDALVEDLRRWLKLERGGPSMEGPYRDAVSTVARMKTPNLSTLAAIALLPFLDLALWHNRTGEEVGDAAMAHMLGIDRDELRKQTRKYADLAKDELALRAWLGPLARGNPPRGERRGRR